MPKDKPLGGTQDKPNVLLICPDNWPGRMIGAMGHPAVLTPTLDQLAANGVAYTNAYSTSPMCIPARRDLHTGTTPRTHGDRDFADKGLPPGVNSMAQTFRDAGYQAYAVGKMHVHPQRNRFGFDDIMLHEAGRMGSSSGRPDDYEMFLTEQGYPGQEFANGIPNNSFFYGPWHLPEYCHPTNWAAREMCRFIVRRDPTRPAFWYLAFDHPHPPLSPLKDYMDLYRDIEVDMPYMGEWTRSFEDLPYTLRNRPRRATNLAHNEASLRLARQAYYALSTHVDHQIRTVIGTLREEGLIDNTIIVFTSDHAEMMGHHGIFGKGLFYEDACKIPMILVPTARQSEQIGYGRTDDRMAGLYDVMPTLLELCDIPVSDTVEGLSLLGEPRREYLYGEIYEATNATRMVFDGQYKLIYYPHGNDMQLFDLDADPNEMLNIADEPAHTETRRRLTDLLVSNLYGGDLDWLEDGRLVGAPAPEELPALGPDHGLGGHRGWRFR